jgi:membrane fusion protein, multidrug efflux system
MTRILSLIVFTLFSFSIISCTSSARQKETSQSKFKGGNQRPPVRADAYIVKTSTLSDKMEFPGSIVANQSTEIHPEVAGRITGIYFREGSYVSKGTLLVKLNDADLQAQKRKLLVQLQMAHSNENRSAELLKIQGISKQDYEATVMQSTNINADLAVIETQIEKTNIRAPFAGKLGFRMVSLGAYVSPTTTLTNISQENSLKIEFTVPEKYINQIKNGEYVNFHVEGSGKTYSARVMATESNVTAETRSLNVRAVVVGDQGGLTPGNFAKVIFNFPPELNAIMIPAQAIVPQARGKKVYIYQNGIAKFVDVISGLRDSSNVQITSGLNSGDTVLITGLLMLKPEGKVKLGRIVNGTHQPGEKGKPQRDSFGKKSI